MQPLENTELLQNSLEEIKANFARKAPKEKRDTYELGVKEVAASGILDRALKVGDIAPDFSLSNAVGDLISLKQYLIQGPVVLVWYRGGWCPYCNLTLRFFQQCLPDFHQHGANLLALTPELPDRSLSTKEKNALDFEVLTDLNNAVAREFGLVFKLHPKVSDYYRDSFDLRWYNGHDREELPLAATYVIDSQGVIRYSFLDADYRKRAEPAAILEALSQLV